MLTAKKMTDAHRSALVEDVERGVATAMRPEPWQTDTCIGGWHYERRLFDEHRYKTVDQVTAMLVDIVSKNGNLLLSIPLRGDGTIDADELALLEGLAAWIDVNGEGIFGTRPWRVYGEGPSTKGPVEAGEFGGAKDVRSTPYTGEDLRFTTKGDRLYVFALARPRSGKVLVTSLALGRPGTRRPSAVSLLGHAGPIQWAHTTRGLELTFSEDSPRARPLAFRVDGVI